MTSAADEPNALGGGRPLRRTLKRSEQVARDILRLTRVRGIAPGSSLPTEASMIAQYGTSRGTLREALRILEVYGLITIKPGRTGGPRLAEVDASDFGRSATFYYASSGATLRDLADSRLIVEKELRKGKFGNLDRRSLDPQEGRKARRRGYRVGRQILVEIQLVFRESLDLKERLIGIHPE